MRLAPALLATLCLLGLGACGDTLQVRPVAHQQLEGLIVAPFPVYWLGGSFGKLQISEVSHDPGDAYAITYGNCIQGGQGYCVPPLRIITSPDNSFLPGSEAVERSIHVRGVTARVAQNGQTVILPTGGVVVDIFADERRLARAAAENLAAINGPGAPGEPLPAALPGNGFESQPLPSQVPNPLHPLGISVGP